MHRKPAQFGFTMVEILVAIAIFALVSTLSIIGLNAMIKQYDKIQYTQAQLLNLERTLLRLTQDVIQVVYRSTIDEFDEKVESFIIDEQSLSLLSAANKNWFDLPRSNLVHIRYEWIAEQLYRRTWPHLDPKIESQSRAHIWLTQVEHFAANLYDEKHEKTDDHKKASYLNIELILKDIGEIDYHIPLI